MDNAKRLYLDAVLNKDQEVLFNGTPDDTAKWLQRIMPAAGWTVFRGEYENSVSVGAYLASYKERKDFENEKKRQAVSALVAKAMLKQDTAAHHQDPSLVNGVLDETVDEILALFVK